MKHTEYSLKNTATGYVYTTLAKDLIDAKEQVSDLYDIDYDLLELV